MRPLGPVCAALAGALISISADAAPQLALDVTLDPESRRLDAVAELAAPADAGFALYRSLSITRVTLGGRELRFAPGGAEGDLRLWRVEAAPGAPLRIEYGGVLPALDPRLDFRRVLQELPPMASPSGTFLGAGSGWYPRPAKPFSYRVKLSLPAGQRGLVPGRLTREAEPHGADRRYIAEFAFEHPAENIDLMAGPYVVREKLVAREAAEPLRLRTYFYPELAPLAGDYLADSARYIARYEKEIGSYPFAGFSVVASPLPVGFGMPTLTYIGSQVLRLPFIRATSLGHEVLHNWWGNGVYVDYAHGNWSEGLTTFMADYAYKEEASAEEARAMRLAWLRDFASLPAGSPQSLAEFRTRAHGAAAAIGYGKAAFVFYMLRDLIGADGFARGVRGFWRAQRFRIASWTDLRHAFEQASGRPLGTFFAQWVERAGAPDVRIVSARLRDGALEATLAQSRPAYELRVPLEIVGENGSETRVVELDRTRQTVILPVSGSPKGLRLDPELRLWRVLDPAELPPILREWILASAPRIALASPALRADAMALAGQLFENRAEEIPLAEVGRGAQPVLLIGLRADVDAALAARGLPNEPEHLAGRGTAQVWTLSRGKAAAPLAVISVRDGEALRALARPLPHYGAQSFLAFDGARAIEHGVWPAVVPLVPVTR
jgi:aminopeptidase N